MAGKYNELIRTLWSYNYVPTPPDAADVLIVMGTDDLGVPRFAGTLARKYRYKAIGGMMSLFVRSAAGFPLTTLSLRTGCECRSVGRLP